MVQKLRSRIGKNKDQTHQAAQLAAEHIWKVLQTTSTLGTTLSATEFPALGETISLSSNMSSTSNASGAMRRGLRRGRRELNELEEVLRGITGEDGASSHQHTTTAGTVVTENWTLAPGMEALEEIKVQHKKKSKKSKGLSLRDRLKERIVKHKKSLGNNEAWMCGVCGRAFATHAAADQHETRHILQVLGDMGFIKNCPTPVQQPTSSIHSPVSSRQLHVGGPLVPSQLPQYQQAPAEFNDANQDGSEYSFEQYGDKEQGPMSADRQDHQGTVAVNQQAPADFQQVSTRFDLTATSIEDENPLLLPNSDLNPLILSDEALINVCRRAEPFLLEPTELAAERALRNLGRDKAYYDDMCARALARQKQPGGRYRSESGGVVAQVQNKLLDAYQLMKEADAHKTGMTTTDQYRKKIRQREKGEINSNTNGQADEDIVHSSKTLYVNVMVRNSVEVVNHELKRLAGELWEKGKQTGTEQQQQLDRFSRFRNYAHHNMVKLAGLALANDFTVGI